MVPKKHSFKMAGPFAQEIATASNTAKPAFPGSAGSIGDQNLLELCSTRPLGLYAELESESQNQIPVQRS